MTQHFADRLSKECQRKRSALCVGLDPRWELLPQTIRERYGGDSIDSVAAAFQEFCLKVLEVVAPQVAVVKPQSAFFEAAGPAGMAALKTVLERARSLGLVTILDNKRNDIASTAEAYADAALAGVQFGRERHHVWGADSLTINPYLGRDAVEPFLKSARRSQGGVFVLVRTSNSGAGQFQDLQCDGRPVYQHVAAAVRAWTCENLGATGLGDVGAVVGATHPREMKILRELMPEVIFLVPGYGAQGGSASDTAAGFRADGTGAIINSSRGIIACFPPADPAWMDAIAAATEAANQELREKTPMGNLG